MAELRNPAGKYVLPTAANVTTALSRAVINEDPHSRNFLQQDLTRVYTDTNPASYPLASYSYLIVPREGTRLPTNFTKAKGRSLSAFVSLALCQGQRQLSQLGYAPLPPAWSVAASSKLPTSPAAAPSPPPLTATNPRSPLPGQTAGGAEPISRRHPPYQILRVSRAARPARGLAQDAIAYARVIVSEIWPPAASAALTRRVMRLPGRPVKRA